VDRDLKHIAIAYLKDNFFFDLISTLPGFFISYNSYFYFVKAIRFKKFGHMKTIMKKIIGLMGQKFAQPKHRISTCQYFVDFFILLILTMHSIACLWVAIGLQTPNSWIDSVGASAKGDNNDVTFRNKGVTTLYITSLYFVATTLATVGYGDIKGKTFYEYLFVMVVEFVGIMFFSFIMGSINNILA
jgi:Ion channel